MRYADRRIQAQGTIWKIDYSNRIVSSFNQDLGISLDRNVGKVKSWGIDGSIAFRPIPQMSVLALASFIDAELQENVEIGTATTANIPASLIFCGATPAAGVIAPTCAPTAGKMVAETPELQFGGRINYEVGPVEFGIQGKRVGKRFATDVNDVVVKGYTLVDFDARVNISKLGLTTLDRFRNTYFQVNVSNIFDEFYFGNLSTGIRAADAPSFAVGSPRRMMATLNFGL